jgi:2-amino-4-hydroxy-6-hydroxymethyldihydropteridine diphosphokinase
VSTAVLSIGSNLGDRLAHLQSVFDALRPIRTSPVYETAPWGGVKQDDYLNAILVVSDDGTDADGWLAKARELEQAAGRTREIHWGPRTLDVDVIDVDGASSQDPDLTLPHPRAHERAFVLVPWADVDPDAILAGHGRIADLITDPAEVRRTDLELR